MGLCMPTFRDLVYLVLLSTLAVLWLNAEIRCGDKSTVQHRLSNFQAPQQLRKSIETVHHYLPDSLRVGANSVPVAHIHGDVYVGTDSDRLHEEREGGSAFELSNRFPNGGVTVGEEGLFQKEVSASAPRQPLVSDSQLRGQTVSFDETSRGDHSEMSKIGELVVDGDGGRGVDDREGEPTANDREGEPTANDREGEPTANDREGEPAANDREEEHDPAHDASDSHRNGNPQPDVRSSTQDADGGAGGGLVNGDESVDAAETNAHEVSNLELLAGDGTTDGEDGYADVKDEQEGDTDVISESSKRGVYSDPSGWFDLHFLSGSKDPKIVIKPQVKNSKHKFFKAYGTNFLSLFRSFQSHGWVRQPESFPTSNVQLLLTKPITVVPGSMGRMISQISSSSCIGGTKGAQLRCRKDFASKSGCSFSNLGISPAQFNMWQKEDCEAFFEYAMQPGRQSKKWIGKLGGAFHGKHMTIFEGVSAPLKKKYGSCAMDKASGGGYIMMDYVANPALLSGHKFDLRTFMLVASTTPYMVFYHEGFGRRSGALYSNDTTDKLVHITNHAVQDKGSGKESHFWGFADLQRVLHEEHKFPRDFMENKFRNRAKHVTNYVFQAARARMKRRKGAFMLFGLDWMVDMAGQIHLLEANGNPSIVHYEGTDLTPKVWNDMAGLVTKLHREPEDAIENPSVRHGYRFEGWQLVFSEPEEKASGQVYSPCLFHEYSSCTDPEVCPVW